MEKILRTAKKLIPRKLFRLGQPIYHYTLAFLGAVIYRFPSRHINVVAITGTKGKTSTAEMVNAVLEAAGKKTALAGTLRFKIGDESKNNMYKMTMPGRFFVQKFLRQAVDAGCEYAILEITSEAAVQFRHKFIDFDALIFLNLSPEHIESHGGYENYVKAKLSLAEAVAGSRKPRKVIVSNADDKEGEKFLDFPHIEKCRYSMKDAMNPQSTENGVSFTYKGTNFTSVMPGMFSIYNMLAAIFYAESQHIPRAQAAAGLASLSEIRGRVQKITLPIGNPNRSKQQFTVIVDYAHTADSLEKVYTAFKNSPKICVLGNTGGGRDAWKRPRMAEVADRFAEHIILTNEDPYDENPQKIIDEMTPGIKNVPFEVIMDRRSAIHKAISLAKPGYVVMITGKGTDPYIMEASGKKTPWSDAKVAEEELAKILTNQD